MPSKNCRIAAIYRLKSVAHDKKSPPNSAACPYNPTHALDSSCLRRP